MDSNRLPSQLERKARDYADYHRRASQASAPSSMNYLGKSSTPDFEMLITSMSTSLTMLYRIVRSIEESEDVVDSLDPEEDIEEYAHAKGELYAAKSLYLTLKQAISDMEDDRVLATSHGMDQRDYFYKVEEHNGIVGKENMETTGFIGRMMGTTTNRTVSTNPLYQHYSAGITLPPSYSGPNYLAQVANIKLPAIPPI